MTDSFTSGPKHKYAISKETIQDNSSHTLRVGVDRQTGETVALALFPRGRQISSALESALVRCMDYHHPHLATLRDLFVTDSDLVVVFDFAGKDSLQSFVREQNGLSEDDARYVFQQLVVSVDYQLRIGASSRGIHIDDVFIERSSGKVRLSVFRVLKSEDPPNQYGMAPCSPHPPNPRAQSVPSVVKMSRTGSPGLNTLFRTSSPGLVTPVMDKSRVRDLGEMLYFLLHARFQGPQGHSREAASVSYSELDSREQPPQPQVKLSPACSELLRKLLARDKLTVAEILKNPWFLVDFPKGLKEMNSYCLKMKLSPEGRQQKVQRLRKVLASARCSVPSEGYPPPPSSTHSQAPQQPYSNGAASHAASHSASSTPRDPQAQPHSNGLASRGMPRPSSESQLASLANHPPGDPRLLPSTSLDSQGIPRQAAHALHTALPPLADSRARSTSSEDMLLRQYGSGASAAQGLSGVPPGVRQLPPGAAQGAAPGSRSRSCSTEDFKVNMANRPLMAAVQNLRLGAGPVRKSRSNEDIAQSAQQEAAPHMPLTSSLKPPLQRWVNEGPPTSNALTRQTWHQTASAADV